MRGLEVKICQPLKVQYDLRAHASKTFEAELKGEGGCNMGKLRVAVIEIDDKPAR